MHPKHADEMENSIDLDQSAPLRSVWSEFTLFAVYTKTG